MSFFRITNPVASDLPIADLGIIIPASAANVVLSNQFSVSDLYLSKDLEDAIINGDLTVQIDYGTGFQSIAALDYTNRDAMASFLNMYEISNTNTNEELVGGADTSLHKHDNFYFTEAELGAPTGAGLIGLDGTGFDYLPDTLNNLQDFADEVDLAFTNLSGTLDLDSAYTNDVDGILNVDDLGKSLDLRSDNVNDISISRTNTTDIQKVLSLDVSADEIYLGAPVEGALPQVDVRVRTNLIIDGDLTFTGTLTDTTVNELNVSNANIRLREGADAIPGTDAYLEVERGTSGNDARLLWDETADRWKAGIVGDMSTIALLEKNETVTGVYDFQGGGATEPSMHLTNKTAAPTVELGTATQIPMTMINNVMAILDKSNSRNKWLSVYRMHLGFSGRDNANNANEYARFGLMTSNQSSARLIKNMTLIGISIQTNGVATWSARVRKNGALTNLASLTATATDGASTSNLNVDFNANDKIDVYIDGSNVNRPIIVLEFAERF